jgi:putative two-component system response regulator
VAQIIGVVDVFDAVTHNRPYQRTRSAAEAVQLLREQVERGWRQRAIVEAFARIVDSGHLATFVS